MTTFWRWQLIAWRYGRLTGGAGPRQARRSGSHCRTHNCLPSLAFSASSYRYAAAGNQYSHWRKCI